MAKTTRRKVPLSVRALAGRINRRLAHEQGKWSWVLKKTRGARARAELGEWYILDADSNYAQRGNVEIEALGRELGVIENYEELIKD